MTAQADRIFKKGTRPYLKTKQFSTLHIDIFEQILSTGKTNCDLNQQFGYTRKSHCVVDHSRKVMYKILVLENLRKEDNMDKVIYPRVYKFWWTRLLNKHKQSLIEKAVKPQYYANVF